MRLVNEMNASFNIRNSTSAKVKDNRLILFLQSTRQGVYYFKFRFGTWCFRDEGHLCIMRCFLLLPLWSKIKEQ